jgi:PEP-CTERM motif-containing protein
MNVYLGILQKRLADAITDWGKKAMHLAHFAAALLITVGVSTSLTNAAVIDGVYSFTASNFMGPLTPPAMDPVFGSFGLSFDTTSSPFELNPRDVSLNFGPIDSVSAHYISILDQLTFEASSGTTAFSFSVLNASTLPGFQFASFFSDTGLSATFEGVVSFTPAESPVPEPSSMVLFSAALVSFGLVRRLKGEF